jgi:hypothetical protein
VNKAPEAVSLWHVCGTNGPRAPRPTRTGSDGTASDLYRSNRAGDGNRNRMTSLEVLSNRICADLLIRTRRSKLSLYPFLSLRPHRCLSHLARHWPAICRDLPLRRSLLSAQPEWVIKPRPWPHRPASFRRSDVTQSCSDTLLGVEHVDDVPGTVPRLVPHRVVMTYHLVPGGHGQTSQVWPPRGHPSAVFSGVGNDRFQHDQAHAIGNRPPPGPRFRYWIDRINDDRRANCQRRCRQFVCHDVSDRPHRMLGQPATDHGGFDCINAQIRCPQLGGEPATEGGLPGPWPTGQDDQQWLTHTVTIANVASRTRDPLLRSSFCGQRLLTGFLIRASLLVPWLCLDVPSFRSVLAHGWHESGIVRFCRLSSVRAAAIAQDVPAPAHDCPLQVRQRPVVGRQLMPAVVQSAEAFVNNLVCCRLVTDEQSGQTCQRRAVAAMEQGYRLIAAIIVHASYSAD